MDDCILHPPKAHTNCETVAFTRSVMLIFTLVHRLLQINTSKDNLQQSYSNLDNYRNAASQRMSFHQSIHLIKNRYNELLADIEENKQKEKQTLTPRTPKRSRQIPNRQHVHNSSQSCRTIPEKVDDTLVRVLGDSPVKVKRSIEKGKKVSSEVQERWQSCLGKPFLAESFVTTRDGKRGGRLRCSCCECGAKTSWYCIECKQWFCMNTPIGKATNKRKYSLIQSTTPAKGTVNFQNACFHKKHRNAWEAVQHKKNNEK
jgi:hypothetical protein